MRSLAPLWLGAVALGWGACACASKEVLWPDEQAVSAAGSSSASAGSAGASTQSLPQPICARTLPPAAERSVADTAGAIARGLPVWRRRTPDVSCAGCHGPDPIDLARLGYSDERIDTWCTKQGLGVDDAAAIVELVHALRQTYAVTAPCDPSAPFLQPGGDVLPGGNGEARDFAFLDELRRQGADVTTSVVSAEQARAFMAGLAGLDLLKTRVGFSLALWSASPDRTGLAATQLEGLPELGFEPDAQTADEWYALADDYLAAPSDAALWRLHRALPSLTLPAATLSSEQAEYLNFQRSKQQAVLIATHMMRRAVPVYPERRADLAADDISTIIFERAPLWDLANRGASWGPTHTLGGVPPEVARKYGYTTDDAVDADMARLTAPFAWLAIAFDPARQLSGERGLGNPGGILEHWLGSVGARPELLLHARVFELLLDVFHVARQDARYGELAHKPPLPNGHWASVALEPAPDSDLPAQGSDYTPAQLLAFQQLNSSYYLAALYAVEADLRTRQHYSEDTLVAAGGYHDYLSRFGSAAQKSAADVLAASISELKTTASPE